MEKYANIAGNPSQEALQEARLMINEGETILAVVKVSEETASRCRTNDLATTAPLAFTVMLPCVCLWCADCKSVKQTILSYITVVTDKTLYRSATMYKICGNEKKTAQIPISQVNSSMVAVVSRCCSKESYLILGVPPGSPMANAGGGGGKHHRVAPNQAKILIDDGMAEDLRSVIEKARQSTPPVVSESMTRGPDATDFEDGPTQKIMKLKNLLDAGAITQSEFDKKKAELLLQI